MASNKRSSRSSRPASGRYGNVVEVSAPGMRRAKANWERIAQEPLEIEQIKGTVYGFGSELAVLRLFRAYNLVTRNTKTRASYSTPAQSWYFSLD